MVGNKNGETFLNDTCVRRQRRVVKKFLLKMISCLEFYTQLSYYACG